MRVPHGHRKRSGEGRRAVGCCAEPSHHRLSVGFRRGCGGRNRTESQGNAVHPQGRTSQPVRAVSAGIRRNNEVRATLPIAHK